MWLWGLAGYGLPTAARIDAVLAGATLSEDRRMALDAQRADFFAAVEDAFAFDAEALAREGINPRSRDAVYGHAEKAADQPEIAEDVRLALIRLQLVRSEYTDESAALSALSRMNPGRLDFDPRFYNYGGAYLYSIGAIAYAGAALGLNEVNRSIASYLDRPEGIARFYQIARGLNALAFLGILATLFDLWRRRAMPWAGVASAALFAAAPVAWLHATVAKPHLYAAAWALLALYCLVRFRTEQRRPLLVGAAVAAGLAMGSALGEALILIAAPLLLLDRTNVARGLRQAALVTAGAFAVFAATNPYYFARLNHFLYTLHSEGTSFGRTSPEWTNILNFGQASVLGVGVATFILASVGALFALRVPAGTDGRIAITTAVVALVGGVVIGELRFVLVVVPLLAFFAIHAIQAMCVPAGRQQPALVAAVLVAGLAPGTWSLVASLRDHAATDVAIGQFRDIIVGLRADSGAVIGITAVPPPIAFTPPLLGHPLMDVRREVLAHLAPHDPRRTPDLTFAYSPEEDAAWAGNPRYALVFDARAAGAQPSWLPRVVQFPATNLHVFARVYRRIA